VNWQRYQQDGSNSHTTIATAGKLPRMNHFTWYWLTIPVPFSQFFTTWCLLVGNVKGECVQLWRSTKNCACSMARDSQVVWLVALSCWYHCLFTNYVIVSLTFTCKAVCCRLHGGECSTCWRTCAWFSFVEIVTGQPDFSFHWPSILPEWWNFVMIDNITVTWC
jgi:hypothetical protein